ncbi:urotensin 2 domain containing [Thalassophryne amazonica]|uniref:urotensin 2 domain containing n=1 Tax=Thalassophryne amazonica TaxID=390379 RepID=UPI001470F4E5|nr:urotensin 2 domain containing [Thalassophryne amazonica]
MDRIPAVNYCLGLVGFLMLLGALNVEGRSIFNSGNQIFDPKEDMDAQSRILTLLLQKGFAPGKKENTLGLEFANSLAEELQALRENLELEQEISASMAKSKSISRKRGEPCFWKYCV